MTRRLILMTFAVTLVAWPAGRAAAEIRQSLAPIPQDAAGFVCVPNLKALDADIQQAITTLGLEAMAPPPMNSIVSMLKMNMPMLAGLDESKPVAYVVMPMTSPMELEAKSALVFSAQDPNAALTGLGGTAGEEGIWTVNIMGQSQVAKIKGNQIVLGKSPDTVKAVAGSEESIAAALNKHDAAALGDLDLVVWIDGQKLFAPMKPQLNGLFMMMMMQAQAQGMTPASVEQSRKSFEEFIDGLQAVMLGVSVQNEGIGLRGSMSAKPGSELGKKMTYATTEGSLLDGLPGDPYLLAFGHVFNAQQAELFAAEITKAAEAGQLAKGVDEEKLGRVVNLWTDAIKMYRGMRFSVEGLEPGAGGLVGLTKIIEVTDSERVMQVMQQAFEAGKALVMDAMTAVAQPGEGDMVSALMEAVRFELDKEQVADTKVAQLRFDLDTLAKLGDLDENDLSKIKKVVGQEGLLFRAGAVDKDTLVVSFGGGQKRFASSVARARSDQAPLASDDGIKRINRQLPDARASVLYVAPDQIIKTVQNVQRAMGEEPLPIQFPKPSAPIVIGTTGVPGWARGDVFVPMDIVRTATNAAMASASGP
jgi:hypothetical protein